MALFLNRPLGEVTPVHGTWVHGTRLALYSTRFFFLFFPISPRPLFLHGQSNPGVTKAGMAWRTGLWLITVTVVLWFPRYIYSSNAQHALGEVTN